MVPVASCGVMAASLWDKHSLWKGGRTIANQCVQLPDDTQRSGVEAASHFTPRAFSEEAVFPERLSGWLPFNGLPATDHKALPTSDGVLQTGIMGDDICWVGCFFPLLFHTCCCTIYIFLLFFGYSC